MKKLIFSFSAVFCVLFSSAQIVTTTTLTVQQYVQNVLLGGGVSASNITYTGYAKAIGSFTAPAATNLSIGSGLVLTTGTAELNDPNAFGSGWPQGPSSNMSSWDNATNGSAGDPDLDNLTSLTSFNACILEFDFVPQADTVKFNYRFGSEEYNDYVNTSYNDVFGFFLTGISTPLPQTNIALIPGIGIPVSINNVNNGYSGGVSTGPCTNCTFYNDNINGGIDAVYDGLTTVLTAKYPVICGETYHIKIAIGDVGDGALDSGVFLEAGSFSASGSLFVNTDVAGSSNDTLFYEGCGNASFFFVRPQSQSTNSAVYTYTVNGTASNGTDYNPPLSGTFSFLAGEDSATVSLAAINDGFPEGLETITIMIIDTTNACGNTDTILKTIYIQDLAPLAINSPDTTICYGQNLTMGSIATGGQAPYTYTWTNSSGTVIGNNPTVVVSPTVSTSYIVSMTDQCNSTPTSHVVNVTVNNGNSISALFDVFNSANDTIFTEGCDSVQLRFSRAGTSLTVAETYTFIISGTATNNIDYKNNGVALPNTVTFPSGSVLESFTLKAINDLIPEGNETILINFVPSSINICAFQQSLNLKITIRDLNPITTNSYDTTICAGTNALIGVIASGGASPLSYSWSNGLSGIPSHYVNPFSPTTYTVTVSDQCGSAPKTEYITVTTIDNPPIITSIPDAEICMNKDGLDFTTIVTNGVPPLTYNWYNSTGSDVISQVNPTLANLPIAITGGVYIFSVLDKCHKSDQDTIIVTAVDCEIVIPNIITPNGDNINEFFFVKNLHRHKDCTLTVYDRWGTKKYENENYLNDWKPSELHDGQYYYLLNIPDTQETFNGYFMIVK